MDREWASNQPTILLLGASHDQLFAIRTAKKMGLRTLVVDQNENSPGFSLADDFAVISTRDTTKIKLLLDEYKNPIKGVLVMGSDIPQIVAELTTYLGTPGVSLETANLATNKMAMKRRFHSCNIPIPWFSLLSSASELESIAKYRGFPLVIKPIDRSGARGVYRLTHVKQIKDLFKRSKSQSFCNQIMVEDFIEGLQISTESILYAEKSYTVGFADRNYDRLEAFSPNIIENGGWLPSLVSAEDRQAVANLVENAALALGIKNGVAKGDVVLTKEGPVLIEMAARLSGGDFSESLIPLGCGVNIVAAAIDIAMGHKPDLSQLRPKWNRHIANRYFFSKPGKLLRIEGTDEVKTKPWIKKLEYWYQPGDIVPPLNSHGDRFGVFIIEGNSREEVNSRVAWVYRTIHIETIPEV